MKFTLIHRKISSRSASSKSSRIRRVGLVISSLFMLLSLMLSACTESESDSPKPMTVTSDSSSSEVAFESLENDTSWQITAWEQGGVAVASLPAVEISVDLDNKQISGFSGCNNFGGSFTLAGEDITIGQLRSTQRSCEETIMNQEAQFLQAIQSVQRITSDGDQLILSYTVDQTENNLYFSRM